MSKLTTDVVTYCTEASDQKSKYAYRKIFFYKKALPRAYILNEHHMHNRVAYPICICSPARFCTKLTGWVLERGLAHPQENEMSFILKYLPI